MLKLFHLTLFILLVYGCNNTSEAQGFEIIINDNMRSAIGPAIINNYGDVISVGASFSLDSGQSKRAFIISISQAGDTTIRKYSFQGDTLCNLTNIVQISNQDNLVFGVFGIPESNSKIFRHIWMKKLDQDLNTIWNKSFEIPENYWNPGFKVIISNNGLIYLVGTIALDGSSASKHLFMMKLNENGDTLKTYFPNDPPLQLTKKIYSLLPSLEENGVIAVADGFDGLTSLQILEIDSNLNYTMTPINDPDNELRDQATAKWFSDSSYLICSEGRNVTKDYFRDIQVNLMNTNHQFIDRLWLERPDTNDTPAWVKSIDYIDKNNIWVAGSINHAYPEPMDTEVLVYLIDEQLNIKGLKYYGGDMNYSVMTVTATPDGGCVLAGTVCDWQNSVPMDTDIWIKKIFPSDILTHAEDTPDPFDKDALVYPNPFSERLFIKTSRIELVFKLYNLNGEEVISSTIISESDFIIDTQHLVPGVYVYELVYKNKTIQTGKLIK
jgi:hypothetical protein